MANKEYIERTEILKMLDERYKDKYRALKNASYIEDIQEIGNEINELKTVIDIIEEDIPAADVEPVKHAEWKFGELCGQEGWYCTHCGAGYSSQKHGTEAELIAKSCDYCPKCGAKMV